MMNRPLFAISIALIAAAVTACDPERLKQCEWYIVPEPSDMEKADPEMIAVCARNFVSNKQHCRLQTSINLAKNNFNQKMRFVDIDIDRSGKFPRTITSVKLCK